MAKSKVAKKFHLDPDGYLTTKPDRQLTTEEEATDAAEAAIEEALEEGGVIAEAIAASGTLVVNTTAQTGQDKFTYDIPFNKIADHILSGGNVVFCEGSASQGNAISVYPLAWYGKSNDEITTIRFSAAGNGTSGGKKITHVTINSSSEEATITVLTLQ